MPIYEFSCNQCGNKFEKLVFHSDEDEPRCPACGSQETKKILSAFSSSSSGKKIGASCSSSSPGHS